MSAEIVVPDWLVERRTAPPPTSSSDLESPDLESHEREALRQAALEAHRAAGVIQYEFLKSPKPSWFQNTRELPR